MAHEPTHEDSGEQYVVYLVTKDNGDHVIGVFPESQPCSLCGHPLGRDIDQVIIADPDQDVLYHATCFGAN